MGHNGCDGSQASGPWAIGSGYRFNTRFLPRFLIVVKSPPDVACSRAFVASPWRVLFWTFLGYL